MTVPRLINITLASASEGRRAMLEAVGFEVAVQPARVDETAIAQAMMAEGFKTRDVADALAALKAEKIGSRMAGLVVGADQVLDLDGRLFEKPGSPEEAIDQLAALCGKTHTLHSAAVVVENGETVWRAVSSAQMTMRPMKREAIERYVEAYWDEIRWCVGAYRYEAEGALLFERVRGDGFTIQGLPLTDLLNFLILRGSIVF